MHLCVPQLTAIDPSLQHADSTREVVLSARFGEIKAGWLDAFRDRKVAISLGRDAGDLMADDRRDVRGGSLG